jgi:SAV_6107-like HEPN
MSTTQATRASTGRTRQPAASRTPEPAGPFSLPATTHSYLARSAESLRDAMVAPDVPTRYACAHVAALRAAAALLAARARPTASAGSRRRQQKNAWVLLTEVAPELTEWATFFAAGAAKRAAAEAGSTRAVTEREADDLVRDADRFLAVVEQALGLTPHVSSPQRCALAEPVRTRVG